MNNLIEHGAEGFQKVLDTAHDALTYKWRQLSRHFAAEHDLTGRQKAVREYLDLLGVGPWVRPDRSDSLGPGAGTCESLD
jgi:hypothetical protein